MAEEVRVLDERDERFSAVAKFDWDLNGFIGSLQPGEVGKIISRGDLRWLERRFRMYTPGKYKFTFERDETENVYVTTVERL